MSSGRITSGESDICDYFVTVWTSNVFQMNSVISNCFPLSFHSRRYDSFVNWDFFPSIQLPILVYFKETQTPKVSHSRRFMFEMKKVWDC